MDILQQLGQLGDPGGTDGYKTIDDDVIERNPRFQAGLSRTTDNLRYGASFEFRVTRVFSLGGVNREHVLSNHLPGGFNTRSKFFFGGAWVGGAFQ